MLFPRLIAGPIVRHHEIMSQFDLDPRRDGLAERVGKGATLLVIGLAAKVFLADRLARVADQAFEAGKAGNPDLGTAWSGALAFTFQLFLDFSGLSDMAHRHRPDARALTLPRELRRRTAPTSLRDFWQRWHMTLSRYLRDYVYIPLGGNRRGFAMQLRQPLFVTMALGGLWHGAGLDLHRLGRPARRRPDRQPKLATGGLRAADAARLGLTIAVRHRRLGAVSRSRLRHGVVDVVGHGGRGSVSVARCSSRRCSLLRQRFPCRD